MEKKIYHHDADYIAYLIEKDPKLEKLFLTKKEIIVHVDDDYFNALANTIIAQQLSSKVASILTERFRNFFEQKPTPEDILKTDDEALRALGLSYQKIKYIKSLSEALLSKTVHFDDITELSDNEVIEMLIQIKGIGVWSAQMFLIFSLGREDVFSVLDLGLRNALKRIYDNPDLTPQEIEQASEKWSPYRSIVSHFLWHAWDFESK